MELSALVVSLQHAFPFTNSIQLRKNEEKFKNLEKNEQMKKNLKAKIRDFFTLILFWGKFLKKFFQI